MKLCEYGCGREAKYPPRVGKSKWSCEDSFAKCPKIKEKIYTKERAEKIRKSKLDIWNDPNSTYNTQEFKDKIRNGVIKKVKEDPSYTEKISKTVSNLWKDSEYRKIQTESHKEYYKSNPESLEENRKRNLELWKDPEYRKRQSEIHKISMNKPEVREINKLQMKENWKDPNFLKKMRETRNIEPTLPEKKLIKILLELKSNFEYTGDYKISIDGRVPDFTDLVNKKVIEVFSEYYHGEEFRKEKYNDSKSNKDHEKEKIDHYKLNGYECLVLWESELKNEEYSKEKIKKFLDDKEN